MGVLQAARALHLRVPEDLAVIGFDDIDAAEVLGLTTVRQPLRDTGLRGTELLLEALHGERRDPAQLLVPLTVIARRTT